ncbi:hypothetical protein FSOLCH5_013710 [Fusarium solani]
MCLSLGAALLALAPTVLGWKITLYDQEDCNDHGDNFSYYVVTGEGDMDYCVGLAATPDEVPSNVHCSYFTDKGRVGPLPCDGQFRAGHSVRVFRGEAEFYEQFDRSDNQPIYHRCYVRLQNIPGAVGETGFVPQSSECHNIYVKYDGGKIEAEVGGYRVWEYTGKDGPE